MQLNVNDFSSIASATLDLNQINVIVGPQASGKSILCKLTHFFVGLTEDQVFAIAEGESYSSFTEATRRKFMRWFPIEGWGDKKFELSFVAGQFEAKITRTEYKGKLGQTFRMHFSEDFKKLYSELANFAERPNTSKRDTLPRFPMPVYELRQIAEKLRSNHMGKDFVESQLFIPAGRSFFTSMGHAIAIFEQSNTLDPLTIAFGRLFRAQLDSIGRRRQLWPGPRASKIIIDQLGGELAGTRGNEHLAMTDGRKIPLALLSSGQQELLPLLTVLPAAFLNRRQLVYIEEPEAHLFPQAQSNLVQALVSLMGVGVSKSILVLTTHSPYVLSKFNNLLKAGMLGRGRTKEKVKAILPEEVWLGSGKLNAYAIREGRLVSILGKDGLIDGDYLDDVSGMIGDEFDRLIDVEIGIHA